MSSYINMFADKLYKICILDHDMCNGSIKDAAINHNVLFFLFFSEHTEYGRIIKTCKKIILCGCTYCV